MEQAVGVEWSGYHVIGPKLPLKLKEIWSVRIRLQMANKVRDLALFDLGLDSKLRGCDLVKLRLAEVFDHAAWSCSKRRDVLCNLKSQMHVENR
jgi:hypothetical protein